MKETNSQLLDRIVNADEKRIQWFCFYLLLVWTVTPLVIMLLNFMSVDGIYVYLIWTYLLYFIGAFGLASGVLYFIRLHYGLLLKSKTILSGYLPIFILGLFLVWAFVSSVLAKDSHMAFYGLIPMTSSWFTFLSFGGFLLAAIVCSNNKNLIVLLARILVIVSVVQAVFTIIDNEVSFKLNTVEPYTNCFHYQSVFYNTNHYAYYLLMTIVVAIFLFVYSKSIIERAIYIASYILLLFLLILNDTFGAYLSLIVTFLIALTFSSEKLNNVKKALLFLVVVFIIVSLISLSFTDNLKNSFEGLFFDVNRVVDNKDVDYVGSSRGVLWRTALESIKANPVFGCGFENMGAVEPENDSGGLFVTQPHNFILFFAKNTGIPGLILYLSALLVVLTRLIRKRNTISEITISALFVVMAYLISAFFGVVKFYTSPYYVIALGICIFGCSDMTAKNISISSKETA